MTLRTYASPEAFKQALEQRLRSQASSALSRKRQLVVFDRFLARLAEVLGSDATLKGGLVLELRLRRARATKDIDLRMLGHAAGLLERLQQAGRKDLGDFMAFEVRVDESHPEIQAEGMRYDGLRFRAQCKLAGKPYGYPFGVDVAFGDPMLGEPEVVVGEDVLGFAGIAPPTLRIYPVETHLAEKLHAYTLPRSRPNSRVKDLPDIALLSTTKVLSAERVRKAIAQTFAFRDTHPVPGRLPSPPAAWRTPYAAMARDDGLPWPTLDAVIDAARTFVDPLLAGDLAADWQPELLAWKART